MAPRSLVCTQTAGAARKCSKKLWKTRPAGFAHAYRESALASAIEHRQGIPLGEPIRGRVTKDPRSTSTCRLLAPAGRMTTLSTLEEEWEPMGHRKRCRIYRAEAEAENHHEALAAMEVAEAVLEETPLGEPLGHQGRPA